MQIKKEKNGAGPTKLNKVFEQPFSYSVLLKPAFVLTAKAERSDASKRNLVAFR
ncbi:MAG: hypothetical protein U5L09_09375 [Bacteroidales bacterium]|nr:hypothetical protein [Bacteroidales bacterium]